MSNGDWFLWGAITAIVIFIVWLAVSIHKTPQEEDEMFEEIMNRKEEIDEKV